MKTTSFEHFFRESSLKSVGNLPIIDAVRPICVLDVRISHYIFDTDAPRMHAAFGSWSAVVDAREGAQFTALAACLEGRQ